MVFIFNLVIFLLRFSSFESRFDLLELILASFFTFLVSFLPVFISKLRTFIKNYLGYGIPLLLLGIGLFSINFCSGWDCLVAMIIGANLILFSFVFLLFYFFAVHSQKMPEKIFLVLIILLPLLMISGLFLLNYTVF